MSYRIVEESEEVRRAIVIGQQQVSTFVAASLTQILGVETTVFDGPPDDANPQVRKTRHQRFGVDRR